MLTLGGTNTNYYTGSIYYTPITTAKYWQFKMTGILISGSTVITTNAYAIADTGTTLIIGPSANIISINNYIGATRLQSGSTWYLSSCNLRALMPSKFYFFLKKRFIRWLIIKIFICSSCFIYNEWQSL